MKEVINQCTIGCLGTAIQRWIPLFLMFVLGVATACGQSADGTCLNQTNETGVSATNPADQIESDAAGWTEYEINSIRFRLPDHWHVLKSEKPNLKTDFTEVKGRNPELARLARDSDMLHKYDVVAVNIRDSREAVLHTMRVKRMATPDGTRTKSEEVAEAAMRDFLTELKAIGAVSELRMDKMNFNGQDVTLIKGRMKGANLQDGILDMELRQYVIATPKSFVVVGFGHSCGNAKEQKPVLDEIVKTFRF